MQLVYIVHKHLSHRLSSKMVCQGYEMPILREFINDHKNTINCLDLGKPSMKSMLIAAKDDQV
jgi:hypothetical protein